MTKREFLDKLKKALANDLSGNVIRDNVDYYNDYIKDKGYNYYTIVDKSNKNKGIVFPACMPYASYGNIDNTGGITNSDKEIEITDTSVIVTSE